MKPSHGGAGGRKAYWWVQGTSNGVACRGWQHKVGVLVHTVTPKEGVGRQKAEAQWYERSLRVLAEMNLVYSSELEELL